MAAADVHGSLLSQHYSLMSKVGEGCYGCVYAVLPRRKTGCFMLPSKPCACKAVQDHNVNHEVTLSREAGIMQELKNIPNVVSFKGFHRDENGSYLIMELCDCDLWDALQRGVISHNEPQAAHLVLELARTIKAIHSKDIVHRDLKPDNILVTANKRLKLADFGSAVHCRDGEFLSEPAGTARYAAPEMYRGSYGKQVDVYGLGLILFVLIEGEYPFKNVAEVGTDMFDFMYNKGAAGVDVARQCLRFNHASKDAKELILKMTAGEPSQRMTIDEVLKNSWLL